MSSVAVSILRGTKGAEVVAVSISRIRSRGFHG
jgi:hypothetical protein